MKTFYLLIVFLFVGMSMYAQKISGQLSLLANQSIRLEGFDGLKTYPISNTLMDANGNFSLPYSQKDYGVGYLISADDKPLFVILSGEDIQLVGEALSYIETIRVVQGAQNQWFEQYGSEHPRREQALSAWNYLQRIYGMDPLFKVQTAPSQSIQQEIQRIKSEDSLFLVQLPKDSYVRWFLPVRKLVSSASTVAQYMPEELPATIAGFRAINYADPRLYKSGLFKDAIDNHFWLIENSGVPVDSVQVEMTRSIDAMLVTLAGNDKRLNEVTDHLFDLLERHSLFKASEYLALKVLNEVNCNIDDDLANQLETYRKMKKGNIAPDIIFKGERYGKGYTSSNFPKKMSDLKSKYTLVIFAASWCPKCQEEIPEIVQLYDKWKAKGIEVILVSLDDQSAAFQKFAKDLPFLSVCDLKKWESPIVSDYHVFGTPTLFLLDNKREILLRPNSVKQVDAWVDWVLVEGNQ